MRPSGDAQRKHRLVEEGGEWTGTADSTRRYTYWNWKSKEANKKNAKPKKPRCAGILNQKLEQLAQQYSTSIGEMPLRE